jgi:serine/threonine protein kinase
MAAQAAALADQAGPTKSMALSLALSEKPGDKIGRYKLLEQIGEGGFGVVYVADQEEPVHRRVALKVIKLGMDTKEVIARFEAERQALALMDHPNIAKVFDAGATASGRPFFVMEWVKGERITEYCDKNNLTTRQRLDLFVHICHAIQHAHQKGIIHRDIKPSNILVALQDGAPVPKVIDFGIAKATERRLTDKTIYTALEQIIGTPAYMSPEQAEMTGVDIDTRSDIYSLGVLLYELLTGKTPFDAHDLLSKGLAEMRRAIREQQPRRPSTRLTTMDQGELTTTARRRQTDPPKLVHLVRGDLDLIVMKCLAKDRTHRYDTASALAADLLRHLNNEPVLACPPSNTYRFLKMVRRNRLAFAAAAAVALALLLGIVFSSWEAGLARQAERREAALREKAQSMSGFLLELFRSVNPTGVGGASFTVKQLLDSKESTLDMQFTNQPETLMTLHKTIGMAYDELRVPEPAQRHLAAALELKRRLTPTNDLETAEILEYLSYVSSTEIRKKLLADSMAIVLNISGSNSPQYLRLKSYFGGASFYNAKTRPDTETIFIEVLRTVQGLTNMTDDQIHDKLEADLVRCGDKFRAGDVDGALALIRNYDSPFLSMPVFNREVPMTLRAFAIREREAGHTNTVEPLLLEAMAAARVLSEEDPRRADICAEYAGWLRRFDRHSDATNALRTAWNIRTNKLGLPNEQTMSSGLMLANSLLFLGQTNEADSILRIIAQSATNKAAGFGSEAQRCDLLLLAARFNYPDSVKALLDAGAPVTATNGEGCTALHWAAYFDAPAAAAILLERGADLRATTTNGLTPLHLAARNDSVEVARMLLQHGAMPNSKDRSGATPLHLAARWNHVEVVRALLAGGADRSMANNSGQTALQVAEAAKCVEAAAALRQPADANK